MIITAIFLNLAEKAFPISEIFNKGCDKNSELIYSYY